MRNLPSVSNNWINHHLVSAGALYTQDILEGKWKICIINQLSKQSRRFNELKRIFMTREPEAKDITDTTLNRKLRELIADGIIGKKVYSELPPHTEYYLTQKGEDIRQVIDKMSQFGLQYSKQIQKAREQKHPAKK